MAEAVKPKKKQKPSGMAKARKISEYPVEFLRVLHDAEKGREVLLMELHLGQCPGSGRWKTAFELAETELQRFRYFRIDCRKHGGREKELAEGFTWRNRVVGSPDKCWIYLTPKPRPDKAAAYAEVEKYLKGEL